MREGGGDEGRPPKYVFFSAFSDSTKTQKRNVFWSRKRDGRGSFRA